MQNLKCHAKYANTNLDAELPGGRPAHDDCIASKLEDIASVHLHGVRQQACSPFAEDATGAWYFRGQCNLVDPIILKV